MECPTASEEKKTAKRVVVFWQVKEKKGGQRISGGRGHPYPGGVRMKIGCGGETEKVLVERNMMVTVVVMGAGG